jgi:hypothetical protein
VLGVASLLIFGVGKSVSAVTGDDEGPEAGPSTSSTTTGNPRPRKNRRPAQTTTPESLTAPDGPCDPDDLTVTPVVTKAYGGDNVTIGLAITSTESPACTFEVSPTSVVMRIVQGEDRIWSTQDCADVLPTSEVIARPEVPGFAHVIWNGRRSAPGCPAATTWLLPGTFHVQAAAFGSGATDVKFELLAPKAWRQEGQPLVEAVDDARLGESRQSFTDRAGTKLPDRLDRLKVLDAGADEFL